MRAFAIVMLGLVLAGCRHESDPTGNAAPVLRTPGNKALAADDSLSVTLQTTDADGDALSYSSDGSVGPNKNPYAQTTPAVFDSMTATFSWTPTSAEIGTYSVQFTITDATAQPLSDNKVIAISVMAAPDYRSQLFAEHCSACHGTDGAGASGPNIRGKTAADIGTAIQTVDVMKYLQDILSARDIEHVADHIVDRNHAQSDLSRACGECHNGGEARGKPAKHMASTNDCASCHTLDTWIGSKVDHAQVIGTCASCHNGAMAQGQAAEHVPTSALCEACHETLAWKPTLKIDHAQLVGTFCIRCHFSTSGSFIKRGRA